MYFILIQTLAELMDLKKSADIFKFHFIPLENLINDLRFSTHLQPLSSYNNALTTES